MTSLSIEITTLNINRLNTPIKSRVIRMDFLKKQYPTMRCLQIQEIFLYIHRQAHSKWKKKDTP